MTTLPQFWFYAAVVIAPLLFLLGAEFVHATRKDNLDGDRGVRWFNVFILFIMVIGVIFLTYRLELHRKQLLLLITEYPSARYAPEREPFGSVDQWIYVSHDTMDAIVLFYQEESVRVGYTLIPNKGTTTSRFLFTRDEEQLFLTIEDEGNVRALYYSKDGQAQIAPY